MGVKIEDIKPKKRHCKLMFWEDKGVYEVIKEFLIEDEKMLSEILNIGYTQNETQPLFDTKHYSYLTIDSVYLEKELSEKDKKSLEFVTNYLSLKKEKIPNNCVCFDFSFPGEIIGGSNWEINEIDNLSEIAKTTISDDVKLNQVLKEHQEIKTNIKSK